MSDLEICTVLFARGAEIERQPSYYAALATRTAFSLNEELGWDGAVIRRVRRKRTNASQVVLERKGSTFPTAEEFRTAFEKEIPFHLATADEFLWSAGA